jgi:membrane protease YdiL (CAAX protease family)
MTHRWPFFALTGQCAIAIALLIAAPAALGPHQGTSLKMIVGALLAGVALHAALAGRVKLLGRIHRAAVKPMLIATLVLLLSAIADETIWRGFAFNFLVQRGGTNTALVIATLGFAVMHGYERGWAGLSSHILTGCAFAAALLCSGSVLVAVVMHIGYNLALVAGTTLPARVERSDPRLADGAENGRLSGKMRAGSTS